MVKQKPKVIVLVVVDRVIFIVWMCTEWVSWSWTQSRRVCTSPVAMVAWPANSNNTFTGLDTWPSMSEAGSSWPTAAMTECCCWTRNYDWDAWCCLSVTEWNSRGDSALCRRPASWLLAQSAEPSHCTLLVGKRKERNDLQ